MRRARSHRLDAQARNPSVRRRSAARHDTPRAGTPLVRSIPQKEERAMTRQILSLVGAAALVLTAGSARAADDPCFYKGSMFSDGATACQSGRPFKCDDGEWKSKSGQCQDTTMKLSR